MVTHFISLVVGDSLNHARLATILVVDINPIRSLRRSLLGFVPPTFFLFWFGLAIGYPSAGVKHCNIFAVVDGQARIVLTLFHVLEFHIKQFAIFIEIYLGFATFRVELK